MPLEKIRTFIAIKIPPDLEAALRELLAEMRRAAADFDPGSHRWDRVLIAAYGLYVRLWYSGHGQKWSGDGDVELDLWQRWRRPVMQTAVVLGPTMHLSLMMMAGATNHLAWYFWFSLVGGTAAGLAILGWRTAVDRRLGALVAEGAGH